MEIVNIQIKWQGPYSLDEAEEKAFSNGLYLLAGKQKYERVSEIKYCGITKNTLKKRFNVHHKLKLISRDLNIWFGSIVYPNDHSRNHLEIAEKIIIYFWQPCLNDRKRYSPPKPTTLISQWFKKDGAPRINQLSVYKELHDVLSWDGKHWRSGNLEVYKDEW
ncbi:MAG: hypothetical protein ACYCY1_15925 [Sulfuriferula sp.]